jgi:hypothetical protein
MTGVLHLGAGRRDPHAGQAEADGDRRGDGVAILDVDEIDLCVGRRGRFAGVREVASQQQGESQDNLSHSVAPQAEHFGGLSTPRAIWREAANRMWHKEPPSLARGVPQGRVSVSFTPG